MSVTVSPVRAEEARAVMLDLFPEGFEEVDQHDGIELAAYTDAGGEERIRAAFGGVASAAVASDWADRWRRFHRPVRIGTLWVGPPWEEAPADAAAIVIDPGRAFGTGAHATTQLCLELLVELTPAGSVLDVGCGSGVLAIAAARLGFAPVLAVDRDEQALEVARANAVANGVEIAFAAADALAVPLPAVDVALVNVTLDVAERVAARLAANRLVSAGYLVTDRVSVPGFRRLTRREREGWAADLWERANQ